MSNQYWKQIQYILSFWDSKFNLLLDIYFGAQCILFCVKHQKPTIIYNDYDTSALMFKWLESFASSQFYHYPVLIHTKWWHSYVGGVQFFKQPGEDTLYLFKHSAQAKILYTCSNSQLRWRYWMAGEQFLPEWGNRLWYHSCHILSLLYYCILYYCIIVILYYCIIALL